MTKQVFWAVITAIAVGELLFLLFVTLPAMSEVSQKKEALKEKLDELSRYNRKDIPVREEVEMHRENKRRLKEGYIALIEKISEWERKRWELWLKRGEKGFVATEERPSIGDFRTLYTDAIEDLKKRCRKVKLQFVGEGGDEMKQCEAEFVRDWQQEERFAEPGSLPTSEDVPPTKRDERVLWVANVPQLNKKNMRKAMKEFWIQQTLVKALIEGGATKLIAVRIVWGSGKTGRARTKEKEIRSEIDRLFDKVKIYVFAEMPYSKVGKFVGAMLRWNDPDNRLLMRLARLEVRKQILEEITVPDPRAVARIPPSRNEVLQLLMGKSLKLTSSDIKGVFPVVIERFGEVLNLGTVDRKKLAQLLPRQDELLSEPSVMVAAKFVLYDLKDDAVEATKNLDKRKRPHRSHRRRR